MSFKVFFIIFASIIIFQACSNSSSLPTGIIYETSFENPDKLENKEFSTHGFNRSNKVSFEGKWSLNVSKNHNYQINFKIDNIKPNEIYDFSIWRYGSKNAYINIVSDKNKFSRYSSKTVMSNENGWDLLVYRFKIPPFTEKGNVTFYISSTDTIPAYFDNLKVEKISNSSLKYNKSEMISIDFDTAAVNTIIKTRERAIQAGVYIVEKSDIVEAKVKFGNDTKWHTAEIRLKGDWPSHLQEYRWSYRIKLTDGSFWKGMRTFSIQKPDSRGYVYEWLFHKLLEKENILTTRYGFAPVTINNRIIGTYAWEEHFEKQIVENKKRREGPIIKLDENIFWKDVKQMLEGNKFLELPFIQAAKIIPFKKNKTLKKNKQLKNIFENGQNNIFAMKFGVYNENTVDIEMYSKMYALIDIFGADHMYVWHNRRFYINPVSLKLEPIAFDGFTEEGFRSKNLQYLVGYGEVTDFQSTLIMSPFTNKQFVNQYTKHVLNFSNIDKIKQFINNNKTEIDNYIAQIKLDEPYYHFDTLDLYKHISKINKLINKVPIKVIETNISHKSDKYSQNYPDYFVYDLINFFREKKKGKTKITVFNYNNKNINIIGFSVNKDSIEYQNNNSILKYEGKFKQNSKSYIIDFKKPKYVYFKIEGNNKIFKSKINNWKAPTLTNTRDKLLKNKLNNKNIYNINGNNIIFNPGKHTVSEKIIIPKGYTVIINKATEINFTEKSFFYSESPIIFNGTIQNPIIFTSSDKSAKGIFIIETDKESVINNTIIENFNTFSYKGWKLTGALSFYKADVKINNITIKNNLCEDGINLINTNFEITNSKFINIYSDALDADFCEGEITNTSFKNIKNDGIDISTSTVEITTCNFDKIGDKAISAGENSTATANKCNINNASFGFVSKDKSVFTVSNSEINNSDCSFAAYIKKMEFGASVLNIKNVTEKNIKNTPLIDINCKININNKMFKGTERINVDSLYLKWKR